MKEMKESNENRFIQLVVFLFLTVVFLKKGLRFKILLVENIQDLFSKDSFLGIHFKYQIFFSNRVVFFQVLQHLLLGI